MTRIHHGRAPRSSSRSRPLDQSRAAVKKKKPYKIVLEAVTQEKKKLQSIPTYAAQAPPGFGYIPLGFPEVTEWCKEQCRQRNLDVHVVSAKPKNKMHADPEKLSHHVHRIGHHFPMEIITLASSKFGYKYKEGKGLRKLNNRTDWIAEHVKEYSSRQSNQGRPASDKEDKEYIRGAVREMFSKIPEDDLNSIVNHAFEAGTNRVGNAKELPLARRVQLAVVAHIRHVYTDYDQILKIGTWTEARQKVEHVSLAKLKEWRDEAGEPTNEVEDTFREVIVLDDEDTTDEEDSRSPQQQREQSMEIVSHRANARDLPPEPERRVEYPRVYVPRVPFVDRARSLIANTQPILKEMNGRMYHLEPIRDSSRPPRSQHDLLPRVATVAQGDYVPPPPTQRAYNRPPVNYRRVSEQDVVLPSVEGENVDLDSPRRTARQPDERQAYAGQSTLPSYQSGRLMPSGQSTQRIGPHDEMIRREGHLQRSMMAPESDRQLSDIHSPRRARPLPDVIDLTFSPQRARIVDERRQPQPSLAYPASRPSGISYVAMPSRRSPIRESRGPYHEFPAGAAPRARMPDHGMFDARPPPAREHFLVRDEQRAQEELRYLRSGTKYGGHGFH